MNLAGLVERFFNKLDREIAALAGVQNRLFAAHAEFGGGRDLARHVVRDDDGAVAGIATDADALAKKIEELEFRRMFSGPMDEHNAFVDINAGQGGTEAQDWAEMLLRMYPSRSCPGVWLASAACRYQRAASTTSLATPIPSTYISPIKV